MSTLKEIRYNLRQKGASGEDIKATLRIMVRISCLDELVFSQKESCLITFVPTRKHRYGYPVAYARATQDKEESYLIFVNGIADFLKEEKKKKRFIVLLGEGKNCFKLLRPTWDGFLVPIAAHEVRHRVQRRFKIRKFTPKSCPSLKDRILKSMIEFRTILFREKRKIYMEEGRSQRFIKDRINPREFDAGIIESLVASIIYKKNAWRLRKKIASLIKGSIDQ